MSTNRLGSRRRARLLALVLLSLAVCGFSAFKAAAEDEPIVFINPNQVLLIGFPDFESRAFSDMPPVEMDVKRLGATLSNSGQYQVTVYRPGAGLARLDPEKAIVVEPVDQVPEHARLMASLRSYLDKLKRLDCEDKKLILYISTHGFLAADGTYHLALPDTTPEPKNSLPYDELFDLLCDLPFDTVLMIDACYAGAANLPTHFTRRANDNRLFVMTASRKEQTAGFFQKQSCYSFWLDKGLLGFADTLQTDGVITAEELHDYCYRHMSNMPVAQRPMRFVLGKNQNPELMQTVPVTWDVLLESVAELVNLDSVCLLAGDKDLCDRGLEIQVRDFTFNPLVRSAAGASAAKGKEVAARLRRQLQALAKSHCLFTVLEPQKQGPAAASRVRFVVTGEIEAIRSDGDRAMTNVRFLTERTDQGTVSTMAGVAVELCGSEACDFAPACVPPRIDMNPVTRTEEVRAVPPSDFTVPPPIDLTTGPPPAEITANEVCVPHVLVADPRGGISFQGRCYTIRPMRYSNDRRLRVDLKNEEEFILALDIKDHPALRSGCGATECENRPYLFVKVLVDGRSTLPYGVDYRASIENPLELVAEEVTGEKMPAWLSEAQPWYIESPGKLAIPGFVPVAQRGVYFPFVMKDDVDLSGGQILIAIYEPVTGVHRGAVMPGEERRIQVRQIDTDYCPGRLIGTYCIEY